MVALGPWRGNRLCCATRFTRALWPLPGVRGELARRGEPSGNGVRQQLPGLSAAKMVCLGSLSVPASFWGSGRLGKVTRFSLRVRESVGCARHSWLSVHGDKSLLHEIPCCGNGELSSCQAKRIVAGDRSACSGGH